VPRRFSGTLVCILDVALIGILLPSGALDAKSDPGDL
jgi:hypothetical protein